MAGPRHRLAAGSAPRARASPTKGLFGVKLVSNLRVRTKLFAGFGVVLGLLAVIVGLAVAEAGAINDSAEQKYVEDAIPLSNGARDALSSLQAEQLNMVVLMTSPTVDSRTAALGAREHLHRHLDEIEPLLGRHPAAQAQIERMQGLIWPGSSAG